MSYFVVIRGPAGVGKSVVAKLLAKALNASYFSFDEIMEKNGLDEIIGGGISSENFLKANGLIVAEVIEKLKKGTVVILDGCFYRKEQLENLEKRIPFKHHVFSLNASLQECISRNKTRKKPMTDQAVCDVHLLVSKLKQGNNINSSGKTALEVVHDLLCYLKKEN